MSMDNFQVVQLLVNGGMLVALLRAIYVMGELAVKLEARLTRVETDVDWVKNAIGHRRDDKGEHHAI